MRYFVEKVSHLENLSICNMYWFAECHLFYETYGVQCLLSEGLLRTFYGEGASSDHRGLNVRYIYMSICMYTL